MASVLQDQEYRAYVRSLPQEQRDRAQRLHPEIAAAVAMVPAVLSGVPESVHDELVNDMLRKTHGAELAKVAADAAAPEIADQFIREADKEIRSAVEVAHSTDLRVWAKPLREPILTEARHGLRRSVSPPGLGGIERPRRSRGECSITQPAGDRASLGQEKSRMHVGFPSHWP
ncbi:hypothetical protein [Bradyrhizobium sp. AZCC 1721]|uniref:hypothetical protein n=1 Tax=Bradyrhizobium sp. AZCC 1721 TaxID=3117016 RepID=UPI002FF166BD